MSTGATSESMSGMSGASGRQKASDALREAAKRLHRRASGLEDIAVALDRCVPTSLEDGSEGHPHIGVGSAAEVALWDLAGSIR